MPRLVVLAPVEQVAGWRLAGVRTEGVRDVTGTARALLRLLDDREVGILAVDADLLAAVPEALRARAETSVLPVIVPIPSSGEKGERDLRGRLADALARAVGWHVHFRGSSP
jgi:V/A-type H+-transporting ATPase subunit F